MFKEWHRCPYPLAPPEAEEFWSAPPVTCLCTELHLPGAATEQPSAWLECSGQSAQAAHSLLPRGVVPGTLLTREREFQ